MVNSAGPCKTLSSLLTVMILLPLLGGKEESVEEEFPGWDNNYRTPGKEPVAGGTGRSSNRGSNTS